MARRNSGKHSRGISHPSSRYAPEMHLENSADTKNSSMENCCKSSDTVILPRKEIRPGYEHDAESDSVEILYNQINRDSESEGEMFTDGSMQGESVSCSSEDLLNSRYDHLSYCGSCYSESTSYYSESQETSCLNSSTTFSEPFYGYGAAVTLRQSQRNITSQGAGILDTSSVANNDGSGGVIVLRDDIPDELSSNESDIRVISSVIQEGPNETRVIRSLFREDTNDYSRILDIESMPQGCRLRLIHSATIRLWSKVVHSETFPSLGDFRTLSRGLHMIERATEWDPSGGIPLEQDASRHISDDALDDMFPEHPPAISQYRGPIRYDLIEYECIDTLMERICWVMRFGTHREVVSLIRLLTNLAAFFSRIEVEYIAEVIRDEYRFEGFSIADASFIIVFAHDWVHQSTIWREFSKKKYNVVSYSQLLDVRDTSCQICYEKYKDWSKVSIMDCLHLFHSRCLNMWLRESPRCPLCRSLPTMPNHSGK